MPLFDPNVTSISNADGTLTISPTTGNAVASIPSSVALPGSPTTTTQGSSDNSTKIATTSFVTTAVANAVSGINPAVAVQAATTANISGFTYSNGVSGVGATLTQNSAAVFSVDGYTPILNDRVLFKNQSTAANNGIYVATTVGTSLIPAVFTRALDYDQPSDMNNTGAIPVANGTINASTSWVLTSAVATVGTSPLTFTQFSLNPTTIATLSGANAFTGVNSFANQAYAIAAALTPGSTVAWNLNTNQAATLAPTQNFTLSNPTNMQAGATYTLIITQDATGGRVITWSSNYTFPGGTKFVLSTAANAIDLITFYSDGTNMYGVGQQAFA